MTKPKSPKERGRPRRTVKTNDIAPTSNTPDPEEDEHESEEVTLEEVQVPVLRRSPRLKKGAESVQQEFNHLIKVLLIVLDREGAKAADLAGKLTFTGKTEEGEDDQPADQGPVTRARARLLTANQSPTKAAQDLPGPDTTLPFLPLLEGYHMWTVWVATKEATANRQDPNLAFL